MSSGQLARVPSGARDAIVPPDVRRFAIQKVDRLQLARMEECHNEIAHDFGILDTEDEPVSRSLYNAHSVDSSTG